MKAQDKAADTKNRWQSGVLTEWTPPCRAWPFCQRVWHGFASLRKQPLHRKGLETDEWPMASMKNPGFDDTATIPQVSLRCMTHDQDTAGSNQVMAFRKCYKDYRAGGKWAHHRLGPRVPLPLGDTYYVDFNFDSFDPNNQLHNDIRE